MAKLNGTTSGGAATFTPTGKAFLLAWAASIRLARALRGALEKMNDAAAEMRPSDWQGVTVGGEPNPHAIEAARGLAWTLDVADTALTADASLLVNHLGGDEELVRLAVMTRPEKAAEIAEGCRVLGVEPAADVV